MDTSTLTGISTRRYALTGAGSVILATTISPRAIAMWPWFAAFSAAVAAGWLVEAIKNWGLVPQSRTSTPVAGMHAREVAPLEQQGYSVKPLYKGNYSGGDFELSEARSGDALLALGTTNHGNNTCTLKFDKADSIGLGLVSNALRKRGFSAAATEAATLPIHPPGSNQFVGDRRYSPTYMTPAHGTIAWSTDVASPRPNFATSIRSGIVDANLRFAQLDGGNWTFDMTTI